MPKTNQPKILDTFWISESWFSDEENYKIYENFKKLMNENNNDLLIEGYLKVNSSIKLKFQEIEEVSTKINNLSLKLKENVKISDLDLSEFKKEDQKYKNIFNELKVFMNEYKWLNLKIIPSIPNYMNNYKKMMTIVELIEKDMKKSWEIKINNFSRKKSKKNYDRTNKENDFDKLKELNKELKIQSKNIHNLQFNLLELNNKYMKLSNKFLNFTKENEKLLKPVVESTSSTLNANKQLDPWSERVKVETRTLDTTASCTDSTNQLHIG